MSGGSKGYDPAKTGKTFGDKLTSYLNGQAPGPSAGTTAGISSLLSSANPTGYGQGVGGAISSFADTAAGKNIGVEAPGYRAVRDNLRSDIMGDVNASVGGSGRYGSNIHTDTLTDSLTSNLGALDMAQYNAGQDRQVQAAQLLPQLQTAATQPGLTQLMAGQIQDANADPNYDRFRELLGDFTGSQGNAGMKPETPWWQTALGYIAGNAGQAVKML